MGAQGAAPVVVAGGPEDVELEAEEISPSALGDETCAHVAQSVADALSQTFGLGGAK